jgi:hypothetical protein
MKHCYGCKQDKPAEAFHRNRRRKDGLNDECKDCRRALDKRKQKGRPLVVVGSDSLASAFCRRRVA